MNCNCNDKAIIIVRGNDTNFNDGNFLTINLNTTILDLSTFKATFKLGSIFRQIDDISSGAISLNFTAAETSKLPQFCYGTLKLIDASNRVATIESLIPFQIISVVNGNAIATEPYTLNFDVKQQGETILNVSVESAVTVELGTTTTLPAGSDATVTNSGSFNHLVLDFGIPRGADGSVLSVNGKTGDVVLDYTDVGANPLITSENMLNADLVDDTTAVHKFATAEELTQIETNKNDITALDNKYDSITGGLSDSITALDNKYDSVTGALDDKIDSINGALSDSINALDSVVSSNYTTLDGKIDSVNGALSDSITGLDTKYDSITGALSDSISAIDSTIGGYGDIVTHNVSEFATAAQGALADTAIQPNDNVSELTNDAQYITIQPVNTETTNRENADLALQQQIDAIVASSDVFDIVGTYAELQAYDITTVPVNDIIKVLVDSTHDNAATYYRCVENNNVKSWSYIGAEGAYYTKSEADGRFVPLTRTVNNKALSNNITLTASDVGALPDNTTIGAGVLTIQKNSTDVGTFGANDTSNKTINLSIPTKLSDITVSAGSNIQINGDTISATDTTYTAGTGIDITNGVISNTLTSAEWGNITGTLSSQTDLQNALNAKEDILTEGDGIDISLVDTGIITLDNNPPYNSGYTTLINNFTTKLLDLGNIVTTFEMPIANYNSVKLGSYGNGDYGYLIATAYDNGFDVKYSYDYSIVNRTILTSTSVYIKVEWEYDSNNNRYDVCNVSYSADGITYTASGYDFTQTSGNFPDNYLQINCDTTISYFTASTAGGSEKLTISCDNTIARVTDIPTNNNQLTNGAGYITSASLPTKVSDLTNDSGYITSSALTGYVTSTDLSTTLADYTLSSSLATVATTGSYNDLTDKPYIPAGVVVDQTYDATSQNAQSGVAIAGAGFLTGITSGMVTTALGYTPYNSSNPSGYQANVIETVKVNGTALTVTSKAVDVTVPTKVSDLTNDSGYTSNIGTVTKVNNTSPDSNGNVTISIPSAVTETTVSGWGFTKNTGTVTSVNNVSPVNGNVTLTIPDAQMQADWNQTTTTAKDYIKNKPTIPTVNNATLTIQKNGTTVKTFTANASSDVTCNITVPTNTNELTNGAGFITGITSSDVTTALGYTPYNSTNPNGYTSNVGTVTKVNNTSPDANGNVSITIPTKVSDLTDDTATYPIDKADTLTGLTASITELNYCDGVTSAIQTQLNGKLTTSDIVSSVSSSSTNSKAVGAKLFYDTCGDIETLINAL